MVFADSGVRVVIAVLGPAGQPVTVDTVQGGWQQYPTNTRARYTVLPLAGYGRMDVVVGSNFSRDTGTVDLDSARVIWAAGVSTSLAPDSARVATAYQQLLSAATRAHLEALAILEDSLSATEAGQSAIYAGRESFQPSDILVAWEQALRDTSEAGSPLPGVSARFANARARRPAVQLLYINGIHTPIKSARITAASIGSTIWGGLASDSADYLPDAWGGTYNPTGNLLSPAAKEAFCASAEHPGQYLSRQLKLGLPALKWYVRCHADTQVPRRVPATPLTDIDIAEAVAQHSTSYADPAQELWLADAAHALRDQAVRAIDQGSPVVFVGHSQGTLMVREALMNLRQRHNRRPFRAGGCLTAIYLAPAWRDIHALLAPPEPGETQWAIAAGAEGYNDLNAASGLTNLPVTPTAWATRIEQEYQARAARFGALRRVVRGTQHFLLSAEQEIHDVSLYLNGDSAVTRTIRTTIMQGVDRSMAGQCYGALVSVHARAQGPGGTALSDGDTVQVGTAVTAWGVALDPNDRAWPDTTVQVQPDTTVFTAAPGAHGRWTLTPRRAGTARVVVGLSDDDSSRTWRADTLTLTVRPAPVTLVRVAGDSQAAAPGALLPGTLRARVVTAQGTPLAGLVVRWTVQSGGGSADVSEDTSDVHGEVTAHWTLGGAGLQTLRAQLPSDSPNNVGVTDTPVSDFTASADPTVAQVTVMGPGPTYLVRGTGRRLRAVARNAQGYVVANAPIRWVAVGGLAVSAASGDTTTATGVQPTAEGIVWAVVDRVAGDWRAAVDAPVLVVTVVGAPAGVTEDTLTRTQSRRYAVTAYDRTWQPVPGLTFTWRGNYSDVLALTPTTAGDTVQATAVFANTNFFLSALTSAGESAQLPVTVLPARVLMTPSGTAPDARDVVVLGQERTLVASVVDHHGQPLPAASVSWTLSVSGALDLNTQSGDRVVARATYPYPAVDVVATSSAGGQATYHAQVIRPAG